MNRLVVSPVRYPAAQDSQQSDPIIALRSLRHGASSRTLPPISLSTRVPVWKEPYLTDRSEQDYCSGKMSTSIRPLFRCYGPYFRSNFSIFRLSRRLQLVSMHAQQPIAAMSREHRIDFFQLEHHQLPRVSYALPTRKLVRPSTFPAIFHSRTMTRNVLRDAAGHDLYWRPIADEFTGIVLRAE
jgi:hypothetical protein